MSIPFRYNPIDQDLVEDLKEKVLSGESAIVLGPRYGGKRYTMYRLSNDLVDSGISPVVALRLPRDPVNTGPEITELLRKAIRATDMAVGSMNPQDVQLLSPLDKLFDWLGKPVVLLTGNIDTFAYHLGRQFLEEVRERVQKNQLVVILSGEENFFDLVYGPKSEFNCANIYVLQGLSEREFRRWVIGYCRALGAEFENPEESLKEMWTQTGGNSHLLRMLLWEIVEKRAHSVDMAEPFRVSDVRSCIERILIPGALSSDVFEHANRLIAHEPNCWDTLDALIRKKSVNLRTAHGAPEILELAGVAVRNGNRLRFSSPLMASYIQKHYDQRRFGDLYMRNGKWQKAFAHYARLDPKARVRPSGVDDRISMERLIKALSAALISAASEGTGQVRHLLTQGCRYVLGFQEITFWHRRSSVRPGGRMVWELEPPEEGATEAKLGELRRVLPRTKTVSPGLIPIPEPWNRWAMAAILPPRRPDQQTAVVVSDVQRQIGLLRARERLTRELLDSFFQAYSHALAVERDRKRLWRRNQHIEVINSIFDSLGSRILDVRHALSMAARGLRGLGYRRVLFCLVNPNRDRIQGVVDDSDNSQVDVAAMTDWALVDPTADLQPHVISTCRPKIVEDARREPRANAKVVAAARMKALAIVPLLNQAGKAVGTVQVERDDGAVPTAEEVEDLLVFGRQLATAIEQSERVNLLQSALDKIPEPVLIARRKMHLRYANKPAATLFAVRPGSHHFSSAHRLANKHLGSLWDFLHTAISETRRLARNLDDIGQDHNFRGAVMADFIEDWQQRNVAGVLHVQDINYLHRVLDALRLIAEASDTSSAMRSILEASKRLGHEPGRLFLVDEHDPMCLVSKLSLTAKGELVENHANTLKIHRLDPGGPRSWLPVEMREPVVYCWDEGVADGEPIVTPSGLEAINSNPPDYPRQLGKQPGDFWIDLPLFTHEKVLGKLSLTCDQEMWPEAFELLKILSEMASGLLDAFLRRERAIAEREQWVLKEAAEQVMAVAAHNIATRLATLPVMLARYQRFQDEVPTLRKINRDFAEVTEQTLGIIERIKERISAVKANFAPMDLIAHLNHILKVNLAEGTWRLESDAERVEIEADEHLLGNAILELLENSRGLAPGRETLFVNVKVETDSDRGRECVRIYYRDNGPGVPDHLKTRIFEDFFSHRPGHKAGIGLGLEFVRRVIEAHGGAVIENGREGEGAEFLMAFPRFNDQPRKETPCSDS